ncbi:MAG: glycosyltransferase family 2 protein [Planctomycetota bacterium]
MRLAVVIPVYNEKPTLPKLLERLTATPPPTNAAGNSATGRPVERFIVLVDDASTDGTTDLVRSLADGDQIRAVYHERNQGKGAALRSGFHAAINGPDAADLVIVQDGDLEYDPADHAAVLAPLLDGRADAVIGTRFAGETHRVLYYWHSIANRAITALSNMLTNLNLTDVECCFKAFRADVLRQIRIEEDRFGVEPELVAKLAKIRVPVDDEDSERRLRIYEVPVSYAGRTYAEGKKITWRDGFAALRCIAKYNLQR